ncbi:hypothetical protein [Cylindrospermopsis raciborskii]|uniref:hypothetical protein n=1 Tax=Cylindrospermopsis raciborskii TaxID=77022 RepID=UPI003DA3F799
MWESGFFLLITFSVDLFCVRSLRGGVPFIKQMFLVKPLQIFSFKDGTTQEMIASVSVIDG